MKDIYIMNTLILTLILTFNFLLSVEKLFVACEGPFYDGQGSLSIIDQAGNIDEIENLGNGLEKHTTTTVEQTETENGTVTTPQMLQNRGFESSTNTTTAPNWNTSGSVKVCNTCGPFGGNALQTGPETAGGTASQTIDLFDKMKNSKQFEFKLSKSFIANILWLEQIETKKELAHLIDQTS